VLRELTLLTARRRAAWLRFDKVLAIAARYATTPGGIGEVVGGYALPVDRNLLSLELINRPHHDYPAWDLPLPEGTP